MRSYPDVKSKWEQGEVKRMKVPMWMLQAVALNPNYPHWGPHEDYMMQPAESKGWNSNLEVDDWAGFSDFKPDELNVFANWYFNVTRASKKCETCGGDGYHPDAQWVSESFYSHSSPFQPFSASAWEAKKLLANFSYEEPVPDRLGHNTFPSKEVLEKYGKPFEDFCMSMAKKPKGCWNDEITEDEAVALFKSGRVPWTWDNKSKLKPKAADYNSEENKHGMGGGHDAINRSILIQQRLKRFGIPKDCPTCKGHGYVYTEPKPKLQFIVWLLHPRKGASRAVTVKDIQQEELPKVIAFLKEAYANATENNWKKVLAYDGTLPDCSEWTKHTRENK